MAIGQLVGFVHEKARRVDVRVKNQDVFHQPLIAAILTGTNPGEQQEYPGATHGEEYTTSRFLQADQPPGGLGPGSPLVDPYHGAAVCQNPRRWSIANPARGHRGEASAKEFRAFLTLHVPTTL